jgi:hypothetical protein
VERQDYFEEETPIPDGWQLDGPQIYVPYDDEDQLEQVVREWVSVLRNVGGVVTMAADKHEIGPGVWRNRGFAVKWNSFAPGERLPEAAEAPAKRRRRRRDPDTEATPRRPEPVVAVVEEPEPANDPTPARALSDDEIDPDNAGIVDDHRRDPADVFAGNA